MAKDGTLSGFVEKTFGDKLKDDGSDSHARETLTPAHPAVTAPVEQATAESGQVLTSEDVSDDAEDWIIGAIKAEGFEFVDKRSSGDNLWVVGDKSSQGLMRKLEKRGAKFTYKENGGKATKHQPAWYIPASVAERALRKH